MKAFANWVMKGRMQAVIAATVLAVLALLITPLGLLSAAVIALTVLRQGWREGVLVVLSALLAIGGLGGLLFQMPVATVLIGAMLWVPAAVLGGIVGRTGSLRLGIEAAAVGAAAVVVLQYGLMSDPAAFWADALNEFLVQRIDPETLESSNIGELVALMSGWMAGGVAATWFLASVASLLLARYWGSLIDQPGAFATEFRQLRFGRWLLLLVPVLLVTGVLMTRWPAKPYRSALPDRHGGFSDPGGERCSRTGRRFWQVIGLVGRVVPVTGFCCAAWRNRRRPGGLRRWVVGFSGTCPGASVADR